MRLLLLVMPVLRQTLICPKSMLVFKLKLNQVLKTKVWNDVHILWQFLFIIGCQTNINVRTCDVGVQVNLTSKSTCCHCHDKVSELPFNPQCVSTPQKHFDVSSTSSEDYCKNNEDDRTYSDSFDDEDINE